MAERLSQSTAAPDGSSRSLSAALRRESRAHALPETIRASLTSPGRPLDARQRARFESRFGTDLGGVRVHDDAAATAAADQIGALGFAFGRHIALRESPGRGDDDLLAHELAHVLAPPRDALIARQTATTVSPEERLRRWLDEHQLAPPTAQPSEGERHVLLNGEDMPVSRAAALAAAAVGLPLETVRPILEASVNRRVPSSALGAPIVGPGNTIPGLRLSGGASVWVGKMLDLQAIDSWLDEHGFTPPDVRDPTGRRAFLDNQETTVDAVADRVMANYRAAALGGMNMSYLTRQEVVDHLRQRYVDARGGPTTQYVFGYTLVPAALQAVTGGSPTATQHQFSFTITRAHHASDSPGLESSFQGAVTLDNSGHVVNVQAGGQEAIVRPLLDGWVQVSGLAQTMVIGNINRTVTGSVSIAPAAQFALGGQVLLTPNPRSGPFHFLRGHVQVGAQVLGAVTVPLGGGPTTLGAQGGFVVNIPF